MPILSPLIRRWRAAGERASTPITSVGLSAFALWTVIVLVLNLDSFDTISADTPLSLTVTGLSAALAGLLTARAVFGPRESVLARNLRISGGDPVGPIELHPPDAVVIRTHRNVLGEVVDLVDHARRRVLDGAAAIATRH